MHILVVSSLYAPDKTASAPLTTDLCRYLVAAGHEVTVVTAFPHYPEWRLRPEHQGVLFRQESLEDVSVRRVWVYLPRQLDGMGHILYYSCFSISAFLGSLGISRPDVVICISPPLETGLTLSLLGAIWRAPLLLWIKDLVIDAAVQLDMLQNRSAIALARRFEHFVYDRVTKIAVLCEGFVENLVAKGVPAEKIVLLPDWVDVDTVRPDISGESFRAENGLAPDDFLVLYSGNVGVKQGLENLVRAARLLQQHSVIKVFIVGEGVCKQQLMAEATELGLSNLKFLPLQPDSRFPGVLAAADALVLHQHGEMGAEVIPSKLLTYMASGRPIVAGVAVESESYRAIQRGGCGIAIEPERPDLLAEAILSLHDDPARRRQMGDKGRAYVCANFSREAVLPRVESVLAELKGGRNA